MRAHEPTAIQHMGDLYVPCTITHKCMHKEIVAAISLPGIGGINDVPVSWSTIAIV